MEEHLELVENCVHQKLVHLGGGRPPLAIGPVESPLSSELGTHKTVKASFWP